MHLVSDRARLATSKCDLTKWVNMPPKTGQRLFDVCGQQAVGRGAGGGGVSTHNTRRPDNRRNIIENHKKLTAQKEVLTH